MLERKPSTEPGKPLPVEWVETVTQLLNQTYQSECNARSRRFEVYGQIFPQELLVVIGFVPPRDQPEGAISCFLSCDAAHLTTTAKVKETQANYVDIAGMFFDEVFADESWDGWEPNWQEVEWKGKTYWYKMTRENVQLTLEADRLLKEAGLEDEGDEYGEDDPGKIIH